MPSKPSRKAKNDHDYALGIDIIDGYYNEDFRHSFRYSDILPVGIVYEFNGDIFDDFQVFDCDNRICI